MCVWGGGAMSVGGYHRLPTRYYLTKRSETTSVLPVNTQGTANTGKTASQPARYNRHCFDPTIRYTTARAHGITARQVHVYCVDYTIKSTT